MEKVGSAGIGVAANVPLTQDVLGRSFNNEEMLAAFVLASHVSARPVGSTNASEEAGQDCMELSRSTLGPCRVLTATVGRHARDRFPAGPWVLGNPQRLGQLGVSVHHRIGPEATIEVKADLILKASCRTFEAIDRLASERGWPLGYSFCELSLQDGKMFVQGYIKLPAELTNNFQTVFLEIQALHKAFDG